MQKILLLEDDLSLADGLTFALHKQGYEVDEKRTVAEARISWSNSVYDLLILDVSLSPAAVLDKLTSCLFSSSTLLNSP